MVRVLSVFSSPKKGNKLNFEFDNKKEQQQQQNLYRCENDFFFEIKMVINFCQRTAECRKTTSKFKEKNDTAFGNNS